MKLRLKINKNLAFLVLRGVLLIASFLENEGSTFVLILKNLLSKKFVYESQSLLNLIKKLWKLLILFITRMSTWRLLQETKLAGKRFYADLRTLFCTEKL